MSKSVVMARSSVIRAIRCGSVTNWGIAATAMIMGVTVIADQKETLTRSPQLLHGADVMGPRKLRRNRDKQYPPQWGQRSLLIFILPLAVDGEN